MTAENKSSYREFYLICFIIVLSILAWRIFAYDNFVNLRSWVIQTDLPVYASLVQSSKGSLWEAIHAFPDFEPGYVAISWLANKIGIGISGITFLNECVFIASIGLLSYRFCTNLQMNGATSVAISVFSLLIMMTLTPFFQSYSSNILRQSLATALVFFGMAGYISGRRSHLIIATIVVPFIHVPSLAFAAAAIFAGFVSKMRMNLLVYIIVFTLVMFVYASEFPVSMYSWLIELAGQFSDKAKNFTQSENYVVGFKWKFAATSVLGFFLLIIIAAYRRDAAYLFFFLNFHAIGTAIYVFFSGLSYYDRFSITSWALVPLYAVVVAALFAGSLWRRYRT